MAELQYERVLLKLSGEALMGAEPFGLHMPTVEAYAAQIAAARAAGARLAVVVGGGNIFRGLAGAAEGMDRASADNMGMLATVMNALALQNALEQQGTPARVMSAIPMPTVCEPYSRPKALRHLAKGRVVIFGGGTGNPYFTTDTAAALRAAEMGCDCLAKATQVDGVYSADPRTHPEATRFERLSYTQVLADDLKVMDGAAIALARDTGIPVLVFALSRKDAGAASLAEILAGRGRCTVVEA